MNKIDFLILTGDGINCENETADAVAKAGGVATIKHINDVLAEPTLLHRYDGIVIPGGFSFGDDISSGQIMALKIEHGLKDEFKRFVSDKKPVLGICNGFQVLVKLGLLIDQEKGRTVSLGRNLHGHFVDTWVNLKVNRANKSPWLKDIEEMYLPIRHGEGRLVLHKDHEEEIAGIIKNENLNAITYEKDVNGSYEMIAGLTDRTGLVLGLMPHPEAAISSLTRPDHQQENFPTDGLKLFENIISYLK